MTTEQRMTLLEVLQASTEYLKKHKIDNPRLNAEHLIGTVEFCGRTFLCDKRAMVPRPETEELVEFLKSEIRNPKSEILDVGTGSGVIALSLATNFPEARIYATDVSEDALALARENAERLGLAERVQWI